MQFWELEPEWDDNNIEHIARHGVEPEEVEEIVYEDCYPSWVVRMRRRGTPETRWAVFGQTCGGRYLVAVIAPYLRREVAQKLTIAQRRALEREAVGWASFPMRILLACSTKVSP